MSEPHLGHAEQSHLAHAVLDPPTAYILQESSQLRNEIWARVEDQRATERYMLLACAVIYSFLLFKEIKSEPPDEIRILIGLGWFVPPLLAFLTAARWCENVRMIHLIAEYIETLEQQILGQSGGWERYLHNLRKGLGPPVLASGYYVAFWLVLVFSTTTVAVYQHWYVTSWRMTAALIIGGLATISVLVLLMLSPGTGLIAHIRPQRSRAS
jgi:hypothetical protein